MVFGWIVVLVYSAVETKVPTRGKALVATDLSIAIPEGTYARIGNIKSLLVFQSDYDFVKN